eukprot:TRINITY_DN18370_c0_g1_i1.p1 TRINITY_DN18370_c0_g1~~TRINITY_DN18370_c0_g1_i1.p1  ORF type:complete len:105 (+),score=18.30 TRINITY_DN18370_c0_g1_i1:131-445(+)
MDHATKGTHPSSKMFLGCHGYFYATSVLTQKKRFNAFNCLSIRIGNYIFNIPIVATRVVHMQGPQVSSSLDKVLTRMSSPPIIKGDLAMSKFPLLQCISSSSPR